MENKTALKLWLAANKGTIKKGEFARQIGVHPTLLSRILRGDFRPGLDTAWRIHDATNGDVPCRAWVPE